MAFTIKNEIIRNRSYPFLSVSKIMSTTRQNSKIVSTLAQIVE